MLKIVRQSVNMNCIFAYTVFQLIQETVTCALILSGGVIGLNKWNLENVAGLYTK